LHSGKRSCAAPAQLEQKSACKPPIWIHNVFIRIVTEIFLKRTAAQYPQAAEWLAAFQRVARTAQWKNIVDLRRTYPHADSVTVRSGRVVIVLNVAANKYRLLTAIHFNRQTIFTLRFLTHAEYSKDHWKNEL
jgi:mRNA interferase HigB